jgi:hypothetical protein
MCKKAAAIGGGFNWISTSSSNRGLRDERLKRFIDASGLETKTTSLGLAELCSTITNTMVKTLYAMVNATNTIFFEAMTMVFVFSTLVFGVEKMFLSRSTILSRRWCTSQFSEPLRESSDFY